MSDEDEDLILNKGPLYSYLNELGLSENVTVREAVQPPVISKPFEDLQEDNQHLSEPSRTILTFLLDSKLLFEHDIAYLLENFPRDNSSSALKKLREASLKYLLKVPLVTILGLVLFYFIGYLAFFFLSAYCAYRAADFLFICDKLPIIFKTLVECLVENYAEVSRVFDYIKLGGNQKLSEQFIKQQNLIVNKLNSASRKLGFHKQFLIEEKVPKTAYRCFLLSQSQFLVALYLQHQDNPVEVRKISEYIIKSIKTSKEELKKAYRAALIESRPISIGRNNKIRTVSNPMHPYVHNLGNQLQCLLIKTREIENQLEDNRNFSEKVDLGELVNKLNECSKLAKAIEIKMMMRQPKESQSIEKLDLGPLKSDEKLIDLGEANFEPEIEDDVFECELPFSTAAAPDETLPFPDEFDFPKPDPLYKIGQDLVLAELKEKIKDQDWLKREAEILRKKYPNSKLNDDVGDAKDIETKRTPEEENLTGIFPQGKGFANDLMMVRAKIFADNEEEIIGCNDSDSESSA